MFFLKQHSKKDSICHKCFQIKLISNALQKAQNQVFLKNLIPSAGRNAEIRKYLN